MRFDGRHHDQLRSVTIIPGFQSSAYASALIRWGETVVLCAASVDDKVPPFRLASGGGWVTAEYNMLPGSTAPRKARRAGGREAEIQRLIGRSLRMAVDMQKLGALTITVDCDVLQADGGTRVASITGGWVALALALARLRREQRLDGDPLQRQIAAVSVGLLGDQPILDLPYKEDSQAAVDMNVVMTAEGTVVELQGTGEARPFSREELDVLYALAAKGVGELCTLQQQALIDSAAPAEKPGEPAHEATAAR